MDFGTDIGELFGTVPSAPTDFNSIITELPSDTSALIPMIPSAPSSPGIFSQIGTQLTKLFSSPAPSSTAITLPPNGLQRNAATAVPTPKLFGLTAMEWGIAAGGLVLLLIVAGGKH